MITFFIIQIFFSQKFFINFVQFLFFLDVLHERTEGFQSDLVSTDGQFICPGALSILKQCGGQEDILR